MNGKPPATPATDEDLGAFYAERARQHREYVAGCIRLADKAILALQPRLGQGARLAVQSLKPGAGQTQVSPNGILQENGVAVFGYGVDFEPRMPPHAVHFFLSVGKLAGDKGKPDDWYVGHDQENFSMPSGGEGAEMEPLLAHVVGALKTEIVAAYPTDARQDKARDGMQPKDVKAERPNADAPKAKESV